MESKCASVSLVLRRRNPDDLRWTNHPRRSA
ncbi:MAG: hypothetical protein J0L75_16850 [Spirochaetes bacterium]|nr:hypothetical protein [Spirochaetota bacterium]